MSAPGGDAPPLFAQVLGPSFGQLPAPVQALHGVRGHARYCGRVTVQPARRLLARMLARATQLPGEMVDAPLTVDFDADARGETWRRDFDGQAMRSRLHVHDGALREWLGPVRFTFALAVDGEALVWRVARVDVFGLLRLPAAWFASVRCREGARDGRYIFEVDAVMPVVGRLVRYEGWLERG